MAKPKTLGKLEARELVEALGPLTRLTLVKRLIAGQGWAAQRVEFSLVLEEDDVSKLASFMSQSFSVDDFGGL